MVFLSSSCVSGSSLSEILGVLAKVTKNIELSGGMHFQENMLSELLCARNEGFNFLLHGYFPPPSETMLLNFADTSSVTRDFISKSVEYASRLAVPYYSVHAGFKSDYTIVENKLVSGKRECFFSGIEQNIAWFYSTFSGIDLAVENLYPVGKDVSTCFCMHYEEIVYLLNRFPDIKFLFDLGHLKVSGKYLSFDYEKAAQELINRFHDRIVEIHLSENDGFDDDHLVPELNGFQDTFLKNNFDIIVKNNINLTIEARNCSIEAVRSYYKSLYRFY